MFARFSLPHLSSPGRASNCEVTWPLRGPSGIFIKGLRDSMRATLLASFGPGFIVLFIGVAAVLDFPTAASRQQTVDSLMSIPAFRSMVGTPINVQRLGGLISWRDGEVMPLFFGLWSIVALSGTLVGEAEAGSFQLLVCVPLSRRRIALEKLAAHLTGLGLAVVVMAVITWLTGVCFATLPGDGIAFTDAAAQFAGSALFGLVAAALAFALAPILGRAVSAGVGAAALFGAYLINAYSGLVPAFNSIKDVSWFAWTANQRPMAGSWDVASLVPVVALVVVLLAIGILAFERRDLGSSVPLPRVGLPGRRFLLRGPARMAFMSTRTAAIIWGLSVGLYGWFIASASGSFESQLASQPGLARFVDQISVGLDWHTSGGLLQLAFVDFGLPLMALAGATFVNGLASEEQGRRLDFLLSTPVSRARWLVASGAGLYASIALLTLVVALVTALGAVQDNSDPTQPFIGMWVVGLYAVALAGVGIALFGLGAGGLAAPVTAALALWFLIFDLVGSSLQLPPDLLSLSLTRHIGQPLAGVYDWPGMSLLTALALGGLLVGAWGMRRRDLST